MRHDKRFAELETLENYTLVDESQDIRGRPLVNPDGQTHGIIEDLLVGKNHDEVVAIRLEDGRICATEPLEIHENAVVYGEAANAYATDGGAQVEEERIPIVEERLAIGKRQDGNAKTISVHTRVVEDTVNENVTLRDEQVNVERRPVNRKLGADEAAALLDGDTNVTMTERSEEAIVAKDAVVTDEVVVTKTAGKRVEKVQETVRRTEVDVDKKTGKRR